MNALTTKSVFVFILAMTFMLTLSLQPISAQQNTGNNRPKWNSGDWKKMRSQWEKRMNDRLKEALKVNDEEWSVLQPRIKKVSDLQRETRAGSMRGWGGRNRGGNQEQSERKLTAIQQSAKDLQDVLEKESSPADIIKVKLNAYRTAKATADANLKNARKELKELLTVNQEAQLVLMGILD